MPQNVTVKEVVAFDEDGILREKHRPSLACNKVNTCFKDSG